MDTGRKGNSFRAQTTPTPPTIAAEASSRHLELVRGATKLLQVKQTRAKGLIQTVPLKHLFEFFFGRVGGDMDRSASAVWKWGSQPC